MKGFEQAFDLLKGFQFEDRESEANALWARHWIEQSNASEGKTFRPPMVIITGAQKKEKHRLIRSLCRGLNQFGLTSVGDFKAGSFAFMARVKPVAVSHDAGSQLQSKELARFLTAGFWSARSWNSCIQSMSMVSFNLRTVILVAAPPSLRLSADLQRRAVVIKLKDRAKKSRF